MQPLQLRVERLEEELAGKPALGLRAQYANLSGREHGIVQRLQSTA